MGNIFAASEVIALGIKIEENGRDFYNTLLEESKNVEAKAVFQYLAGEEEKHIAVFEKLLESVDKCESAESYPGEYLAYMNTLASEYIFTQKDKGKEIARDVNSDKEAVELGIGFEKDSILFYEGMKKMVPEYEQKTIEELITQEQSHLTQLSNLKRGL